MEKQEEQDQGKRFSIKSWNKCHLEVLPEVEEISTDWKTENVNAIVNYTTWAKKI